MGLSDLLAGPLLLILESPNERPFARLCKEIVETMAAFVPVPPI